MHKDMVHAVLRTKTSFFDSQPVGRILNRFSKDVGLGDTVLSMVSPWFFNIFSQVISLLILACIIIPWITLIIVPILILFIIIRFKVMRVLK